MSRLCSTADQAFHRFSRFSKEYRSRLLAGLSDLQAFFRQDGLFELRDVLKKPKLADTELARYVLARHNEPNGVSRSVVKHALLGAQHLVPRLRGKLSTAWENMRVWEEKRISNLRPPLPVPIWSLMLGLARAHAKTTGSFKMRRLWLLFGLLLDLGLLCLLRPGELMKLCWEDFALPDSFTLGQRHAAVRIISPKNRRQFGAQQFVALKNPSVVAWIACLKTSNQKDAVWSSSSHQFSKMFKQLLLELGLESCRFTPGSLRPGGATHLFGCGVPVSTLRFLGRWTAEKSLEHYIQQAMATQIMNSLSEETANRLKKLAAHCLEHVLHESCRHLLAILPKKGSSSGQVVVSWCSQYAELAS